MFINSRWKYNWIVSFLGTENPKKVEKYLTYIHPLPNIESPHHSTTGQRGKSVTVNNLHTSIITNQMSTLMMSLSFVFCGSADLPICSCSQRFWGPVWMIYLDNYAGANNIDISISPLLSCILFVSFLFYIFNQRKRLLLQLIGVGRMYIFALFLISQGNFLYYCYLRF